jgi:hypothetical protein
VVPYVTQTGRYALVKFDRIGAAAADGVRYRWRRAKERR